MTCWNNDKGIAIDKKMPLNNKIPKELLCNFLLCIIKKQTSHLWYVGIMKGGNNFLK